MAEFFRKSAKNGADLSGAELDFPGFGEGQFRVFLMHRRIGSANLAARCRGRAGLSVFHHIGSRRRAGAS